MNPFKSLKRGSSYFGILVAVLFYILPVAITAEESYSTATNSEPLAHSDRGNAVQASNQNALVTSSSPYLLKHATNPINWEQWTERNLSTALKQNRLIFLSIGFYACYWCQVMEKESFRNEKVAAVLNRDYLSLKVDRELLPQLDSYMTTALARVKGSAGWPINAVLTPDLSIVFIDSYLETEPLLNVLKKLADSWRENPERIRMQADMYNKIIKREPNGSELDESTKINWKQLQKQWLAALDKDNGGLKGAPNFPEASLLMVLLDLLQRDFDPVLMEQVRKHLINMIEKGLYDSVNGGFHRYTSKADWSIPHYEKMLYTQALLLEVFSRASRLDPDPRFKLVVRETFAFLKKTLARPDGFYMSSVDAVFEGKEGGFYLFEMEELESTKELLADHGGIELYSNNLLYGFHVQRNDEKKLAELRVNLNRLRDPAQLNIDSKVLVAWNALLISGLKEAFLTYKDRIFFAEARKLGEQLFNHHNTKKQLTRSIAKDTDKTVLQATIEDYAYLLKASLDLFDITQEVTWLKRAHTLIDELFEQLTEGNTIMYSNEPGGLGQKNNVVDGELINPKAVLLENLFRLRQMQNKDFAEKKFASLKTELKVLLMKRPLEQFYAGKVLKGIEFGLVEPVQYFASGNGRVELSRQSDSSKIVKIKMNQGWHVNSHQPLDEELIATRVESVNGRHIEAFYPAPITKEFGSLGTEISVFEEQFSILVRGEDSGILLTLQACSTLLSLCLLPEKLTF